MRDIKPLQQQIDEINNKSNKKNKKIKRRFKKIQKNTIKREEIRKQEEEAKKRTNKIIGINEMKEIETWGGMKMGNIIFDSNIDNWNVNTSVFDQRILNKSNLIFIIEDEDGNTFGGYINANIDKYEWKNDSKSFVFILKLNVVLNGMLKFGIKQEKSQFAFYLFGQSDTRLFQIGRDILFCKENNKNESYCKQQLFDYNGIQNALCGNPFD